MDKLRCCIIYELQMTQTLKEKEEIHFFLKTEFDIFLF
jgi:hypothetical protein